jgi:hypothetical protein
MQLRSSLAIASIVCTMCLVTAEGLAARTFKSPDGGFRFNYGDDVILCKKTSPESNWEPESCESFIPPCEDSDPSRHTMACLAYPRKQYENTNFEAATFVVGSIETAKTQEECLSNLPQPERPGPSSRTINGIRFKASHTDGVATGHVADTYIYRTFHGKTCYELDLRMSWSNLPSETPPRSISAKEKARIEMKLREALNSFRFLK